MSPVEADDDLKRQLMEATRALLRAAIAFENVEPPGHDQRDVRCPYFLPGTPTMGVPTDGPPPPGMSTWSGETNSGFAGDPAYDPPLPDLDTLIGTIDERSGYSSGRTASGDLADLSPNPDSAPLAGYDQCRELADGLRSARLSLRDVVSRVSDSIVQQRIEAVIGLLGQAMDQLRDLEARLGEQKLAASSNDALDRVVVSRPELALRR